MTLVNISLQFNFFGLAASEQVFEMYSGALNVFISSGACFDI